MNKKYDVLIAGTGVSGLYCALSLSKNLNVLLITKSKLEESNTYLAQGGIATAKGKEDIPHFTLDILKAGSDENNISAVKILAEESMKNIENIVSLGVNLDRNEKGELCYTKEGAHGINRIVHSKDESGKAVAEALILKCKTKDNITILENTELIDIVSRENLCVGALLRKDKEVFKINSKVVVLATGGIGGLFKNSTNRRTLTGDGITIALKNNIKVKNLDYIQFHPTAFYEEDLSTRRFLISEALRGEGAKLYNSKGNSFVNELLPRDKVTAAIRQQILETKTPYVFLDITEKNGEYVKNRFPAIFKECLNKGFDITKERIPVSPAQHYFMGGIAVDFFSKTSMENLYAVGETSCTGVHGANRLASTSLLEGLVFSKRAAEDINLKIASIEHKEIAITSIDNIEMDKNLVVSELIRRSEALNDELFCYR